MKKDTPPTSIEHQGKGRMWFWPLVIFNGMWVMMPTFDFNYTSCINQYFSIPYFVLAAVIGIRRRSRITTPDILFLAFGNIAIITLLWHLNPPPPLGS